MKLRDYQQAAVQSLFDYFATKNGNPIIAMPTGSGKSPCIGSFIHEALTRYPGTRVLSLVHSKVIITQNLDKLLRIWPNAPAGIYSASLKQKQIGYPITFGGIATVARASPNTFGRIDLAIIDECHLVSPKEETMYGQVLAGLREINPYLKVIGLTATKYRMGQGLLTEPGGLFTDVCFDMTTMRAFNWLLDEGYLLPLIPKQTKTQIDTGNIAIRGGEYKEDELQAAVNRDPITTAAVQEAIFEGRLRHRWLFFCAGVEHAVRTQEILEANGIPTGCVHSKMSNDECDQTMADYAAGRYRAMTNNGVLTTGFDDPLIDMIVMLRPTRSAPLHVQCLGRGTRPVYAPGYDLETREGRFAAIHASQKQNCLVLDFAGNTMRIGPINDPIIPSPRSAKNKVGSVGMAPVRLCGHCDCYSHASARVCQHCGEPFPIGIATVAGTGVLIRREDDAPLVAEFEVERVVYSKHIPRDENKLPTLKVTYQCGLRMFKEYICLEHQGYARMKAREWWEQASVDQKAPTTIDKAIEKIDVLRPPVRIRVWVNSPYEQVMSHDY
jgi:DNA repair protein RadD